MILDPDACIYDAVLFGNGRTNQRTNGHGNSRSWIVVDAIGLETDFTLETNRKRMKEKLLKST